MNPFMMIACAALSVLVTGVSGFFLLVRAGFFPGLDSWAMRQGFRLVLDAVGIVIGLGLIAYALWYPSSVM